MLEQKIQELTQAMDKLSATIEAFPAALVGALGRAAVEVPSQVEETVEEPPKEEKPKRGRGRPVRPKPEPHPEPTAEPKAEPEKKPAAKAKSDEVTLDKVRVELSTLPPRDAVGILHRHGAKRLSEIEPSAYPQVLEDIREAKAE